MKYTLFTTEDFKSKSWGGGITTELFIHPVNSSYRSLDFDFRLSTATVETDTSVFTKLPGVNRQLLLLTGAMCLEHKNHHKCCLKPGETDHFPGDWETLSSGTCTDFNLMTTGKTEAHLSAVKLEKDEIYKFHSENNLSYLFLYSFGGEISITLNTETFELYNGGLCKIISPDEGTLILKGNTKSLIAITEVFN